MEDLIRDGTPEYEQALETETSEEKVLLASVEIENLATPEKMGEGSQVANEDDLRTKMSVDDHALLDNPLLLSSQVPKTNGENFSPSFKPTGGVEVLVSGLQEGRENMQSQKEGSLGIYPSKSLLHNSQGPKLILQDDPELMDENPQLTQEEDLMDNNSIDIPTEDEESQEWVTLPKKKYRRASQKKKVVVATRASKRIPRDGVPIATKAIQRA